MAKSIIKTWPAFMARDLTIRIFRRNWADYYFTLGKGKPKEALDRIYFTHQGEIIGSFKIDHLVINDGTLPKLSRIDGGESEWQIKLGRHVAICKPPFEWLIASNRVPIYHESFRGWRYFDFETYRNTPDAQINVEAVPMAQQLLGGGRA